MCQTRSAAWQGSAWIAVVLGCVLGCGDSRSPASKHERAAGAAQLPAKPDLHPPAVPERFPDTSFSVSGLRSKKGERLGRPTLVTGFVAQIHRCPAGQRICDPAPYAYLVDDLARPYPRLLVGGTRSSKFDALTDRQQVTLAGTFQTTSEDGLYFDPSGLLVLPDDVPSPPEGATAPAAR